MLRTTYGDAFVIDQFRGCLPEDQDFQVVKTESNLFLITVTGPQDSRERHIVFITSVYEAGPLMAEARMRDSLAYLFKEPEWEASFLNLKGRDAQLALDVLQDVCTVLLPESYHHLHVPFRNLTTIVSENPASSLAMNCGANRSAS